MMSYSLTGARTDYIGTILSVGIWVGLVLLLWMPLVRTPDTIFPSFVGKALYARGVIEIVAALWLLSLLWRPTYRPPRSLVLLAFAMYIAIALLSSVWGVSFTRSMWSTYLRMMGVWDLFHWFLLALVASSVLRLAGEWRRLINWNLGVALALSALALAEAYGASLGTYLLPACRLDATVGNATYLAIILMVTTLLSAGLLAQSFLRPGSSPDLAAASGRTPERSLLWWRVFWGVVAALGIWVLFQTGTRAALIGLVGGAVAAPVALAIWGNRQALRPVALAAGGIILAVAVLFLFDYAFGFHIDPNCEAQVASTRLVYETGPEQSSVAQRVHSIKAGTRAFLDRPLLGWGPENYEAAFDRFVDISYFNYGIHYFDQAHNKPVEELATKGVLGTLAYFAIWAAMVWVVVRRRRSPREEVLAYAVLAALAAYFIQNLFFFDTTPTMLQLALLIAWVARQETRPPEQIPSQGPEGDPPGGQEARLLPVPGPLPWWARGTVATAVLLLAGLSLYHLNYQPYAAARMVVQAMEDDRPGTEKLALAQQSFDTFPPLANESRAIFFRRLVWQWNNLSDAEKPQAVQLLTREVSRGLEAEPQNMQLLVSAVLILRQVPDTQPVVEVMLSRIGELAPQRLQTHLLRAENELLKGNYEEALRIAEAYEARVPGAEEYFRATKQVARERLQRDGK